MLFQVLKTLGDTLGLQLQLQLQPKVTLVIVMVVAIFASVNASPLVAKGKYLSRRMFFFSTAGGWFYLDRLPLLHLIRTALT